jgi:hypothetical protein
MRYFVPTMVWVCALPRKNWNLTPITQLPGPTHHVRQAELNFLANKNIPSKPSGLGTIF